MVFASLPCHLVPLSYDALLQILNAIACHTGGGSSIWSEGELAEQDTGWLPPNVRRALLDQSRKKGA